MAKITDLVVLNSSDKTRMYSVATGKGAPADKEDALVADVKTFPVGSQYSDLVGKKFYVRFATNKEIADWVKVSAE